MSSTRRRGRSPGSPAKGTSSPVTQAEPEVADAQAAEPLSAAEPQNDEVQDMAQDMGQDLVPDAEAGAEAPATVAATAEPVVAAEPAGETVAESTEPANAAPAEAQAEPVTAEPAEAPAAEPLTEAVVAGIPPVPAVPEPVALPVAAAALGAEDSAKPRDDAHIGATFAFTAPLAPFNEINTTLIAFARGEGEAAFAHIQALAKAKSPAEAIRLQVSELQRAANASLTCFSNLVRSANRLGETVRWH